MNINNITPSVSVNKISKTKSQKEPIFKGHLGHETLKHSNVLLRHETAFFRDAESNEFIKKYILDNFKDKKEINIISGACSTGEEAITFAMLLDSIKEKVKILGFDISKDSVMKAKSGIYLMQRPKNKILEQNEILASFYSWMKDSYLAFDSSKALTEKQLEYKKLFEDFFEEAPDIVLPKEKISIIKRFNNWVAAKVFKLPVDTGFDSKFYRLKNKKGDNCKFVQSDIMDIDKLTSNKKADVILFRNALYHLITEDIAGGMLRKTKPDAAKTVEKLVEKLKESLNEGGIISFGENEVLQLMDAQIIPETMRKFGFKPLNVKKEHELNIWQKV